MPKQVAAGRPAYAMPGVQPMVGRSVPGGARSSASEVLNMASKPRPTNPFSYAIACACAAGPRERAAALTTDSVASRTRVCTGPPLVYHMGMGGRRE